MADFHEASQIDQKQAQQEANHHHTQQMLCLKIKKEKMCHKYELESLRLQVQLAQAQVQPHQPQPLPLLHVPKDQVYLPWLVNLRLDAVYFIFKLVTYTYHVPYLYLQKMPSPCHKHHVAIDLSTQLIVKLKAK